MQFLYVGNGYMISKKCHSIYRSFYKKILIDYASYVINKYFYFIFIKMLQYLRHTFGSVRRFLVSLWHSARLLLPDYRLDY